MFVMTAIVGKKCRKLLVYSHASVMKKSPLPARTLPPIKSSSPPMLIVASTPAFNTACDRIAVVVVLPCVPATPIAVR